MYHSFARVIASIIVTAGIVGAAWAPKVVSEAAAPITLTFWYPWGGTDGALRAKLAQEFTQSHPGIAIQSLLVSGDGVSNGKLLASVAGGRPPDVVLYYNGSQTQSLAAQGALTDLTPYLKTAGFSRSQYIPALWTENSVSGHVYGLPEISAIYSDLYYNKDDFRKAGLNPNTPPTTIAQMEAYAKKLTFTKNGVIQQAGFTPQSGSIDEWIALFGGHIYNSAGTKVVFADDPGAKRAFEMFQWFAKTFGGSRLNQFITQATTGAGSSIISPRYPFYTGAQAMIFSGSWQTAYTKQYAPTTHFGVAPIPYPTGGIKDMAYLDSNVWMIPKGVSTDHVKAALEFMTWVNDPARSAALADQVGNITSVVAGQRLQKLAHDSAYHLFFTQMNEGHYVTAPTNPTWVQVAPLLTTAQDEVMLKNESVAAALTSAQTQAQRVVTQYYQHSH